MQHPFKFLQERYHWLRLARSRRILRSIGIDLHAGRLRRGFSIAGSNLQSLHAGQLRLGNNYDLDGIIRIGPEAVLAIGSYCSFRSATRISCKTSISIGSHVFAAPGTFISDNNNHPTSPSRRREMTLTSPGTDLWKLTEHVASAPVVIEDGVWFGQNSLVLKGVTVGRWSIVGAMAVVTKDVPEFTIVAGNPARVVGAVENDLTV